MSDVADDRAVYSISVTSELSGVDPQTLRTYEQRGLLNPFRTDGGTRRYSRNDLDRIADITALLGEGLNLAGIGRVLRLRAETARLSGELGDLRASDEPNRQEIRRLRRENRALKAELARRDDSSPATPGQGPPDHSGAEGSAEA